MNRSATHFISLLFAVFSALNSAAQTAAFSAPVTEGCAPLVVNFQNASQGNGLSYLWDFGNGNQSTQQNPGAIYITPGTYTVKLKVTNSAGTDSVVKASFIKVFANPVAKIGLQTPVSGCSPVTVDFMDSSTEGNYPIHQWLWDFGDGSVDTTENPTHQYTQGGAYTVSLQVTDTKGCSDVISKAPFLHVVDAPKINFSFTNSQACAPPLSTTFSASITGGMAPYSYLWDFGDGNSSVQSQPSHTYTTAGSFDVSLSVTDASGCQVSRLLADAIYTLPPVANFTTSANSGCAPLQVRFQYTGSPANPSQVSWQSGPFNSQSKDTLVTYIQPGEYDVVWSVYNAGCGDTLTAVKRIKVFPTPVIDFYATDTVICESQKTVQFISSGQDLTAWLWSFGNGDSSAQRTIAYPVTTYSDSGKNYNVTLEATNKFGCKATLTKSDYIRKLTTLVWARADSNSHCWPDPVEFTGGSHSMFPIKSWIWSFGNGDSAFVQNPVYTYPDTGKHKVTLTLTDSGGCSVSDVVFVKQGLKPTPAFTADSLKGCSFSLRTQFQNHTNDSSVVYADQFFWDFGTGAENGSDMENPLYHYHKEPKKYTVTLYAYNNGCRDSLVKKDFIHVLGPFLSVMDKTDPCNPTVFSAVDHSIGAHTRLWTFSDDSTSTNGVIYKDFNQGWWWADLVLRDSVTMCYDSSRFTPPPVTPYWAKINRSDAFCAPGTINYSTELHNVVSLLYEFGNGEVTNDTSFSIEFKDAGTYWQKLTIYNKDGCSKVYYDSNGINLYSVEAKGELVQDTLCVPATLQMVNLSNNPQPIMHQRWIVGDYGTVAANPDSDTTTLQLDYPPYNQSPGMWVILQMQDSQGCSGMKYLHLMASKPVPLVKISQEDDCNNARFRCKVTNAGSDGVGPMQYFWTFPNGSTSNYYEYLGNFPQNQHHVVTLKTTDASGCERNDSFPVFGEMASPSPGFNAFPTYSSCPPLLVSFNDTSYGGKDPIVSWEWDFGDGTFSTLRNPKKNYLKPGNYSVKLKVTNSKGCTSAITVPSLVIVDGPTGTYTVTPTEACNELSSHFSAQTQGASKIEWDLGDGNLGFGDTLTHHYNYHGRFIPLLILSNNMGCTYSLPPTDTLYVRRDPVAGFNSDDNCSFERNNLISSSMPVEGNIETLDWWIDGSFFGSGSMVSAVFEEAGEHDVILKCTNSYGCTDSLVSTIVIKGIKVNVNTSDSTLCIGSPAMFSREIFLYQDTLKSMVWEYGDGSCDSALSANLEHTYSSVGKYRAKVYSVTTNNCRDTALSPVFIVGDTIPPPAPLMHRLTVNDALQLEAEHAPSDRVDFIAYHLELEEPGYDFYTVRTSHNRLDTTWFHHSLDTRSHSYRMRLLEENACGKISDPVQSQTHKSIELKAIPDTNAVHLSWNAYEGWDSIRVYRIEKEATNNPGSFILLDSVPGHILTYTDSVIHCYAQPNYRITGVRGDGVTMVSQSDTSKASPPYKPILPLHELLRISVEHDREILSQWRAPIYSRVPVTGYLLEYSKDGHNFSLLGGWMPVSSEMYTKGPLAVDDQSYYFRIRCKDSCGDVGPPGREARSILLKTSLDSLERPRLDWSTYEGWGSKPDRYLVERLEPDGNFIQLATLTSNDSTFVDEITEDVRRPDYCYRITAHLTPEDFPLVRQIWSHSNVSCAPVVSRIFVPNAFTPNGDNLNDSFHLRGMYIYEYQIQIFSRWGELLFESNDFKHSWDGTYNGEKVQQDVYIYIVNAVGTDRKRYHLKGNITLLR